MSTWTNASSTTITYTYYSTSGSAWGGAVFNVIDSQCPCCEQRYSSGGFFVSNKTHECKCGKKFKVQKTGFYGKSIVWERYSWRKL